MPTPQRCLKRARNLCFRDFKETINEVNNVATDLHNQQRLETTLNYADLESDEFLDGIHQLKKS
jgi:hypothetical protein